MTLWPLSIEIIATFVLSSYLIYRYGNWIDQNVLTTITVFISWFFSFIVIFVLPSDISSTAYRQCMLNANQSSITTTTISPVTTLLPPTTTLPSPDNSSVINSTMKNSLIDGIESLPVSTAINLFEGTTVTSVREIKFLCAEPWSFANKGVLLTLWSLVYWSLQLLTWIILPLMKSYAEAGEFTILEKMKAVLIENAIIYGSFAAIFFVLLIYVSIRTSMSWENLKIICVTASNTWGLFFLVVLLGYGLVEIPRSCYYTSQPNRTLSYLYFRVCKLSHEKCEADEKLDDTLDEINAVYSTISTSSSLNHDFSGHVEEILGKCPPDFKEGLLNKQNSNQRPARSIPSGNITVNEKVLARLNYNIKAAVQTHQRVHCQWDSLISKAIDWEDVSKNMMSHSKQYRPSITPAKKKSSILQDTLDKIWTSKAEWYWKCVIRSPFYRCLAYVLAFLSIIVIWSEMIFSVHHPPLSLFAFLFSEAKFYDNYFLIEFISISSIAYLCVCTYYTVFKIRIFNYYYLAPNHQTDESSLLFAGMLLCRLTPPLCLNFLGLMNLDSHLTKENNLEETAFTEVMGHMDVIPLIRDGFNIYLPIVMCLFCAATFFHFGSRLVHWMGIEQFVIDDENTSELVSEGQELVKREKNKRLRYLESGAGSLSTKDRFTYRDQDAPKPVASRAASSNVGDVGVQSCDFKEGKKLRTPRENSKIELLSDVEAIDYSLPNNPKDYRSIEKRNIPPSNLFDDV